MAARIVRGWDVKSGVVRFTRTVEALPGDEEPRRGHVDDLTVTPRGGLVIGARIGNDEAFPTVLFAREWKTGEPSVIATGRTPVGIARARAALSPDGTNVLFAVGASFGDVPLREEGQPRSFDGADPAYVSAVAYAPSGELAASASLDGVISLWSTKRGRALATLRAYGVDGAIVATRDDDGERLAGTVRAPRKGAAATLLKRDSTMCGTGRWRTPSPPASVAHGGPRGPWSRRDAFARHALLLRRAKRRKAWSRDPARYPSFGLRFEVTKAGESPEDLLVRVNAAERGDDQDVDASSDMKEWDLGRLRSRGSLHSDVWRGTAVRLADKCAVAVCPVNGWWRFRHRDPEICERKARHALIVSIETDAEEIDVYTPVLNQIVVER